MKLIKANDLKRWANTLEARGLLPELIRRLVHATKLHLSKVYIPTEESTHSVGWDGIVISEDHDTYLPYGTCLIEMGTDENVTEKANDDYTKRTNDSLGFEKKECTFVFITPREWSKAPSWETNKNKLKEWKNVKVITAVELEDWLSYHPSVTLWLAEKLNISHWEKIQSIESYWRQWSTNDKGQQLCYSVAIGGREESVKEFLKETNNYIAIDVCSHSVEESLAFVVAAILQCDDNSLKNRVLIAKDNETTGLLASKCSNMVIISGGDDKNINTNGNCLVYVTHPSTISKSGLSITLRTPEPDDFINALKESGFNETQARQLCTDTGRSTAILRRKLGFDRNNPDWAKPEFIFKLLPAFLMGRWLNNLEGDKKLIEELSEMKYCQFQNLIQAFAKGNESPLGLIDSLWYVISPFDAINYTIDYITTQDLDNLSAIIDKVANDFDPDDKKAATADSLFWQKNNTKYSYYAKEGLFLTLVLLALRGNKNAKLTPWVDEKVRAILNINTLEWWFGYCKPNLISLLAEASPQVFIQKIEEDVMSGNSVIREMFRINFEHTSLFGNSSHYVYVLSALEDLAWSAENLSRISRILFELTSIGEKDGYKGNPFESLCNIYCLWMPKTKATIEQRFTVLESMTEEFRPVVFKLCRYLVNYRCQSQIINGRIMRWRYFGENVKPVTKDELLTALTAAVRLLTQNCDYSDDAAIECMLETATATDLPAYLRKEVQDEISSNIDFLKGKNMFCDKIREDIFHFEKARDSDWHIGDDEMNWLRNLLETISPDDIIEANLWKFKTFLPVHELHRREDDKHKKREKRLSFRVAAVKELFRQIGFDGLRKIAEKSEDKYQTGLVFAKFKTTYQMVEFVVNGGFDNKLLSGFFVSLYNTNKERYWKVVRKYNNRNDILISIGINEELTRFVETLPEEAKGNYWKTVSVWGYSDDTLDIMAEQLLKVGRYGDVLSLLCHVNYGGTDIPVTPAFNALQGWLNNIKTPEFEQYRHDAEEILEYLDKNPNVKDEQIVGLELLLNEIFHLDSDFRLFHSIYTEPKILLELISYAYRGDEDSDDKIYSDSEINLGILSLRFIQGHVNSCPGLTKNRTLDEDALIKYSDEFMSLAKRKKYFRAAKIMLGQLLGNIPDREDYPQDVLCKLLEKYSEHGRDKSILSSFRCQFFNNRGMTSRLPYDGGLIERTRSEKYKEYADKTRYKYPDVASIFDSLSRDYECHAHRMDNQAELTKIGY
ncbi:MAG: hypothetical protein Q4D41_11175 [Prevotellaceae bacterium]|nr:hypothetical protein [Prevotellaceae bacterium]